MDPNRPSCPRQNDEPTRYSVKCSSCPGKLQSGQYRCTAKAWGTTASPVGSRRFEGSRTVTRQCSGAPDAVDVEVYFVDTHVRVPLDEAPAYASCSCSCVRAIAGVE